MSKSLDILAKNLASGMSRRKAIWQFFGSLGVVAAFTGRKAYAGSPAQCGEFCEAQANIFRDLCIEASTLCRSGSCAEISLIGFNGSRTISVNGGPFICVPVHPS